MFVCYFPITDCLFEYQHQIYDSLTFYHLDKYSSLFTVLFAHFWVTGDCLSVTKVIGISLAFGVILLTFEKNLKVGVRPSLFGGLTVLVSGCLLGLRMVVTKIFVQLIHPYRL